MSIPFQERVDVNELAIVERFINSVPVKVGELAAELGLKVTRAPLPPKISGLIKPSTEARSGYEIKVNKYETMERQRFTVAHEVAHYLLHRSDIGAGVVDSIMYRSSLTSRKEVEANKLAAALVMPAKPVAQQLQVLGGISAPDVAVELAAIFKVSEPAMKVRLGIV